MLIIQGHRVVFPTGERPAAIHIDDGIIVDVAEYGDVSGATDVVDAGSAVVLPGLVDSHVHINEPGRTDWEGFDTATRAAAAGGVTTIVDMPLNSIPATIDVGALNRKRDAARRQCHVDVGFWGGIVPGNDDQIEPLIDAGVRGFKCFMTPSGVDEFACVSESVLGRALPFLARSQDRRPLLVHAEDPSLLKSPQGDPRSYSTFLATRPADAEVAAIRTIARLADEYHVAAHIVHVSSGDGARAVAQAQASGVTLTAETCPHYLTFAADGIPDGATAFKCAPPIRSAQHRDDLWRALEQGICTVVASDHSPAPRTMKHTDSGDFISAWGGIASLELSLRATWTEAARRGFTLTDVGRWMSEGPARLCGLEHRKGAIRPGFDADLVLFDPDVEMTVNAAVLQQRHKLTPYAGTVLRGAVRATYLRGIRIWDAGRLVHAGKGCLMSEPFLEFVDLASERLGGSVIAANDEFFGEKDRLIATASPVWQEGVYTDRGKWVDGWETRRRRDAGHDWCVVRFGAPGIVRGVDVETTHFKGNYPEACAIDVSDGAGLAFSAGSESAWHEVLPHTRLRGDAHNVFPIDNAPRASHLRLRIVPDGGVARLRVYGEVAPDWQRLRRRGQIDLAAVENGGIVVASSDMFFGHRHNLIMPGEARTMAEGWETRRRRGGGHDWTIIRLGTAGTIERVEVDTRHFKGNAPGACSMEGCVIPTRHQAGGEVVWRTLLPRTPLQPDARRMFEDELAEIVDVSYVRFNIFPDGGVARLRLFGRPT